MLHLEAVLFIFLIVEGFELIDSELVELIEVVPPLVARAEVGAQVGVGDVTAHGGSDIEGAHCEDIDTVTGDGTQSGGNALDNAGMDMGTLAGGDMNTHTGAAEEECSFVVSFRDLSADAKSDAMEHILGIIGIAVLGDAQILDLPALLA